MKIERIIIGLFVAVFLAASVILSLFVNVCAGPSLYLFVGIVLGYFVIGGIDLETFLFAVVWAPFGIYCCFADFP